MKNVIVLGATSAIAKALCYKLAEQKSNLILAGRDLEELSILTKDIELRFGVKAYAVEFDALHYDSHAEFFNSCLAIFNDISGVILAYGYLGDQKAAQQNFAEAKAIVDINFTSCVSILEIVADYLEEKKNGFICGISSVAGDRGRQSNYLYGSAKGAFTIYLQGLRNRLFNSGVLVLTVKPGFVDTGMTFGQDGMFLVAKPQYVASQILQAIRKSRDLIYVPWFWFIIMLIIRLLPEPIFKRLKL